MWIYGQANGAIMHGSSEHLIATATGYAGNGPCRNEPSAQAVKNHGPIPRGLYTMTEVKDSLHTGPFTITLEPDRRNSMFGRAAFRIHGDDKEHDASDGCIILPRGIREQIWKSNDRNLLVVEFL